MIAVADIADQLNELAPSLAPELLPNGHKSGNKWMFSGIPDHGKSASAYVHLAGTKVGHWIDLGNAAPGEEKGDMLDLLRLKGGPGGMPLADMKAAVDEAKRRLRIQDRWSPGERPRTSPEELERRAQEARARAEERDRRDAQEKAAKAKRAKGLFLSGEPIAGTPVEHYLRGRGIGLPEGGQWPGALRYHAEVYCRPLEVKVPTMLGAIYRADGTQIGTHRTFLQLCRRRGWTKIDVPDPKRDKPKMVLGNMAGGFVPISKGASGKSMRGMPEDEPVYVTEGIEDALCVRLMKPDARVICAVNVWNMGEIVLPEQARRLVIVADRDDKPEAVDTLERAIGRQQARGLTVELVMPPEHCNGVRIKDINDWLQALQRMRGAA